MGAEVIGALRLGVRRFEMGAGGFPFSWQIIENPARAGYDPASARSLAMDHNRYGLDGLPINVKGIDCDPVTGERLSAPDTSPAHGEFALEPYSIAFVVLAIAFLAFFVIEGKLLG